MPITVKEVLTAAADLVGRSDLAAEFDKEEPEQSGELLLLLRCFNLVENEVALDYCPLKKRETVSVSEGKIFYSDFSEAPISILKVTSISGMGMPFDATYDAIQLKTSEKTVEVIYAFAPRSKSFSDNSDFGGKVSVRLLALGVATEFSLARGLYAEAASYEKRYREALRAALVVKHKLAVRTRRWA